MPGDVLVLLQRCTHRFPRVLLLMLFSIAAFAATPPVYVVLWFDTEDYIQPAADDAALRIATDLERLGVRATFKVVGEKARVLEKRGRADVIRALSHHDIGYHSNFHSIPSAPALYLNEMGWLEGSSEFERREQPGVQDIRRIFGVLPSCYGQPGSSWAPQSYPALRHMGVPVYLDEAATVGVEGQPFWYGGMLNVFNMGPYLIRPNLDDAGRLPALLQRFDQAVNELRGRGGGVISTYFHPTEFISQKFWDAVNFAHGASPERADWQAPSLRTQQDIESRYGILARYVEHAKTIEGVRFVTAREVPQLYKSGYVPTVDRAAIAAHMAARLTFLVSGGISLSAADMLLALLGMDSRTVDGPSEAGRTTVNGAIGRPAFERAKADTVSFIRANGRLPAQVWIGSQALALGDFAATLAADDGTAVSVTVRKGNPEMERYIATDPAKPFSWPIHPDGFQAPHVLDLARLQAWTLKPAVLR
jgi:hypothetical protein